MYMQLHCCRSPGEDISWPYDHAQLHRLLYSMLPQSLAEHAHGSTMGFFSTAGMGYAAGGIYKKNTKYTLHISSPCKDLIYAWYETMLHTPSQMFGETPITFLHSTYESDPKIHGGKTLCSKTPLVISLDDALCKQYSIDAHTLPHYRVKDDGFDVWAIQLHKNIVRKYIYCIQQGRHDVHNDRDRELLELYNRDDRTAFEELCASQNFFVGYRYKRNAVARYKHGYIGGSLWDLVIGSDKRSVRIVKTVLPLGFGERCTAGFGRIR